MLCKKPFVSGGLAFPCGQCQPCRVNRRRMWMHRILLESLCHSENCFLTLTYNDTTLPLISLPTGQEVGSLEPLHLRLWLKRLRERISPLRLRFYAVGEYGERTWRPHYHVCLFGFQTCYRGQTKRHILSGQRMWSQCCDRCRLVGETWGFGDVDLGTLNKDSASYCAEYTVKKMTRTDDPRLEGRWPEFARMSLKPGIGADAMWEYASEMLRYSLDETLIDVPASAGHGKKNLPLGRYLRAKLRLMLDKEIGAPDEVVKAREAELLPLRLAAKASSDVPSFRQMILDENSGRRAHFDAKEKLFTKRRDL